MFVGNMRNMLVGGLVVLMSSFVVAHHEANQITGAAWQGGKQSFLDKSFSIAGYSVSTKTIAIGAFILIVLFLWMKHKKKKQGF